MTVMVNTPMFKCVCPVSICSFAEAWATQDDARAVLLEHFRVTHVDVSITPISSLEQAP